MKLEITPAALEDLRSIRAYTLDRWGAVQEQLYLDQLWRRFEGKRQGNPSGA
jgi:plasmid stabilization system protein ParE